MLGVRRTLLTFCIYVLAICAAVFPAKAEDWLPVTQAELKMTSEPLAPGAPAIILYRQVDRDDNGRTYASVAVRASDLLRLHHQPVHEAA